MIFPLFFCLLYNSDERKKRVRKEDKYGHNGRFHAKSICEKKREIELTDWSRKVLLDCDPKDSIFNIEPVIASVHPLGKRTILPDYEKAGWKEESIQKIETEGNMVLEVEEEQKKMRVYDIRGIEGIPQIKEKNYVIVIEGDIRSFYIEPEGMTNEELKYVISYIKENGDMMDKVILSYFLHLIQKEEQKKTS